MTSASRPGIIGATRRPCAEPESNSSTESHQSLVAATTSIGEAAPTS